jgi:hypothetical protein
MEILAKEGVMSDIAATPHEAGHGLNIGLTFRRAWGLFVKDLAPLLVGGVIAGVLSILTLGILAGPLFAGLYGMVIGRVRDGRQPQVGDIFAGMQRFWSYFAAAFVLVVLIGLASLTIVGGFLLATIWIYVFPLMVDRGMGLGEAMSTSKDMVMKAGFWDHLALILVGFVISAAVPGVLTILTTPFLIVAVTAAYYITEGKDEALANA